MVSKKAAVSSADPLPASGPDDAERLLEVLLVADEHVHVLDDPLEDRLGLVERPLRLPELLAVVEVEGRHGAGLAGGLHALR